MIQPITGIQPTKEPAEIYVYTKEGWEYLTSLGGGEGGAGSGDGDMKVEIYDPVGDVAEAIYTDPLSEGTLKGIPAYVKNNATKIVWKTWTAADLETT